MQDERFKIRSVRVRGLVLLGAVVALMLPAASRGNTHLGFRVGYAAAIGDAAGSTTRDMSMKALSLKSQIPFQIDGAYGFTRHVAAGAYFAYGVGQTDDLLFSSIEGQPVCGQSSISCSGTAIRFGVQGTYTFERIRDVMVPWAGIGLGYERSDTKITGPSGSGSVTLRGFELTVEAGADYPVASRFTIGPFVQFRVGQFQTGDIKLNGTPLVSGNIEPKAIHEWIGAGFRGKFDL